MAPVPKNRGADLLGPVSRKTLAQEVVAILRRFILVEDLHEGDKLPSERQLTAAFGVSHRVVREALGVLSGQGIIVKEHGRGAFVQSFDRDRLHDDETLPFSSAQNPTDLYEIRCAIEVGAMCLAAKHATSSDIGELEAIVDEMTPKVERGESLAADEIRFHRCLLKATHNDLIRQQDDLLTESLRYKYFEDLDRLSRSRGNPRTMEEHRGIIEALRDRDGVRAMQLMHTHVARVLAVAEGREEPDAAGGG